MSECDHIIGTLRNNDGWAGSDDDPGFLRVSDWEQEAVRLRSILADLRSRNSAPASIATLTDDFTDEQLIKDEYVLFKHCPECGAGLTLEALRRDVDDLLREFSEGKE